MREAGGLRLGLAVVDLEVVTLEDRDDDDDPVAVTDAAAADDDDDLVSVTVGVRVSDTVVVRVGVWDAVAVRGRRATERVGVKLTLRAADLEVLALTDSTLFEDLERDGVAEGVRVRETETDADMGVGDGDAGSDFEGDSDVADLGTLGDGETVINVDGRNELVRLEDALVRKPNECAHGGVDSRKRTLARVARARRDIREQDLIEAVTIFIRKQVAIGKHTSGTNPVAVKLGCKGSRRVPSGYSMTPSQRLPYACTRRHTMDSWALIHKPRVIFRSRSRSCMAVGSGQWPLLLALDTRPQ